MRYRILLSMLTLFLLLGGTVQGQGIISNMPDHPLLEMLERVPATANTTESGVYFVDLDAILLQLPEAQRPTSYATWDEFPRPFLRIQTEPVYQYLRMYDVLPRIAGFDFFDINQTLHWGTPPEQATIFQGDLNAEAIIAAHTNRDPDFDHIAAYEAAQINGVQAWCSVNGCDGTQTDLTGRDPSNILDLSGLGRTPPFFVEDGSLTTAYAENIMADIAAVINQDADSLAMNSTYQALAEAFVDVDEALTLVQAQLLPEELVNVRVDLNDPNTLSPVLGGGAEIEALVTIAGRLRESPVWADYGVMPRYELAGIADYHHADYQAVTVATVHTTENTATIAAEEVAKRMNTLTLPFIYREDGQTLFERIPDAEIQDPVIYASSTGEYVALVTVHYPNVDLFDSESPQPGMLMRFLRDAIAQRELYILWQISGL